MKRKFISALLFGALLVASTSTFVSCKDYDDDITELRNQITSNATDLTSKLASQAEAANEAIAELKEQDKTLEEAYKTADAALQAAIAKAEEDITNAKNEAAADATGKADAAEAAAKAYADVQAEAACKAAIVAAQNMVDKAKAELQSKIDEANKALEAQGLTITNLQSQLNTADENIAKNKELIDALVEADKKLQEGIDAAKARADEAYSLAESAKAMAEKNAADIAGLNTKIDEISAAMLAVKEDLEGQISIINGQVADLKAQAETQAASISSLEAQLKSLKESNDKALADLGAKDAELQKLIEDNNTAINNRLDTEVAELKKQAEANLAEAKAYTDALAASVASQISDINTSIENLTSAYKAADEQLQKNIDELKENIEKQIDELTANQSETDKAQDKRIKDLEETLAALENGDVKAFADKVNEMSKSITELQNDLREINANLAIETKRLKGLVFAPTTYVDGIECIWFSTLRYQDWGTDETAWEADKAGSNNAYYNIDDAEHTEEWLVNPKNADINDIVKLEFVSNQATNTRAVTENAPIAVADKMEDIKIANGVMKLKLKKTGTESFGTDRDKFTIVALKATLSDNLLTEQEKEDGVKAEVYSDWARLYETSSTPRIHNMLAVDGAGKLLENSTQKIVITSTNGDETVEDESNSHFWNYSTVYNGQTKTTVLENDFNYRHIAKSVYYEDALDLYTLVGVCDGTGKSFDAKKYGLEFSFKLMDYILKNDGETSDNTNQKNFAKLTDGHILSSTARDGVTTNNRDAIGREPMIQVVLKDMRNAESPKVVDVRYFKIKWVDKVSVDKYGDLDKFTGTYACGEEISKRVLEEKMNALYTYKNMTRTEFHNSYDLVNELFATEAEAIAGKPVAAKLGEIEDQADNNAPGQTHNLVWTLNTGDNAATQAEYDKGQKTITAWGCYVSKTNSESKIVFKLTLDLTINKMTLADGMGKNSSLWSTDGARYINPQLSSDAIYGTGAGYKTSMILGNLLKGYQKNGQSPATINELVNFGTASLVFDDAKLPKGFILNNDGTVLSYNNETAATIDENGNISLYEDDSQVPTDAAKLLLQNGLVAVKLSDTYCNLSTDIESYNVNFLKPLELVNENISLSVKDIAEGGNTVSFAKKIQIKIAFGTKKGTIIYENGGSAANNDAAQQKWYGVVTPPTYDVDNATTNATTGNDTYIPLTDVKDNNGKQTYRISVNSDNNTVTFENSSGDAIKRTFQIKIPVTIQTKWEDFKFNLVVNVEPTA